MDKYPTLEVRFDEELPLDTFLGEFLRLMEAYRSQSSSMFLSIESPEEGDLAGTDVYGLFPGLPLSGEGPSFPREEVYAAIEKYVRLEAREAVRDSFEKKYPASQLALPALGVCRILIHENLENLELPER